MSNMIAAFALLAPLIALILRASDLLGLGEILDIHAFAAAGHLVAAKGVAAVYDEAAMRAMQAQLSATTDYLPWSYPPTTSLLMAPLAAVSWPLAQLLVGLASIAGVAAFAHLNAPDAPSRNTALALIAGPLTVSVASGQFGALFALALGLALAAQGARSRAAAFALVALKPHLLAGGILASLGDARLFAALAAAGLVTLGGFALVEWFHPGALAGWVTAFAYSKTYLAGGAYQLARMVSAYAFFRTLIGHELAMALHLANAAIVIAGVLWIMRGQPRQPRLIALAVAGLTASPYMHDYDMVFLGLAVLLLAKVQAGQGGSLPVPSPALILTIVTAGVAGMASMPLYEATGKFPPTFLALAASAIMLARLAAGASARALSEPSPVHA